MHRRAALLLALTPALPARAQGFRFLDTAATVAMLRQGGFNLYVRHGITDRRQVDTGRRGDRAGQRNLSPEGEAQSRALGEAFRRLAIPVAEVLASEVFRSLETAQLAFGADRVRIHPSLIADDYTSGDAMEDARQVSRLLLAARVTGGNRVLLGHIVPHGMMLGRGLAQAEFPEGCLSVIRPLGDRWEHLGFITAEALITAPA